MALLKSRIQALRPLRPHLEPIHTSSHRYGFQSLAFLPSRSMSVHLEYAGPHTRPRSAHQDCRQLWLAGDFGASQILGPGKSLLIF